MSLQINQIVCVCVCVLPPSMCVKKTSSIPVAEMMSALNSHSVSFEGLDNMFTLMTLFNDKMTI